MVGSKSFFDVAGFEHLLTDAIVFTVFVALVYGKLFITPPVTLIVLSAVP